MLQGDEWCDIECRITDQLIITKSWRWTLSLTNSPSRRLLPRDKVFAVIPGLVISQEMAPRAARCKFLIFFTPGALFVCFSTPFRPSTLRPSFLVRPLPQDDLARLYAKLLPDPPLFIWEIYIKPHEPSEVSLVH